MANRVTVTLATGQRRKLEDLATRNGVKLAFVVRYAITQFLNEEADPQLRFDFRTPELIKDNDRL